MKRIAFLLLNLLLMAIWARDLLAQGKNCAFNPGEDIARREHTSGEQEQDEYQILKVRMVVHIVYQYDLQNISDQQIYSQLKVLNQDYQRLNPDSLNTLGVYKPIAANSRIVFELAKEDEDGNATKGITRTRTSHGPFGTTDIHMTSRGGKDGWDAQKYLNVWVTDLAPGTLGWATPPGTSPELDGVVIDYECFGTVGTAKPPYHGGRTLTHEIGHWLNLQHPWGTIGGCADDDGVVDTPIQAAASQVCDTNQVSCDSQDMVQNFMNLSADDCLNLFTKGQASRMRSVLLYERAGVVDTTGYVLGVKRTIPNKTFAIFPLAGQKGKYIIQTQVDKPSPKIITVTDGMGRVLHTSQIYTATRDESKIVDLSFYPPGPYLIRLETPDTIFTKRILHTF